MTNVQMLVHITGGRADGSTWPFPGHAEPLKVTQAEAEDLYRAQLARPWPGGEDEPEAEPVQVPEPPVEVAEPPAEPAQQWPPPEPGRMGVQPPPEPAPVPEAAEPVVVAEPVPPRPGSPKVEWAAWALTRGASEEEAAGLTKQQLMEKYGVRP